MVALALPLLALAAALAAPPPPVSAEDLARRIERRHRAVADLTARFTQTYRSGTLGREVVERGTLSVRRPGRMRWEYREPERKTFVADGRSFYFYVPADRQVVVRDAAGAGDLPALLLSGQGDLLGQFEAALEEAPEPNRRRLRLTPRRDDPEVQGVLLDVDGEDRIRAISVLDAQGNRSRFVFEGIRENVGLPESDFRFEVPAGVEVVKG